LNDPCLGKPFSAAHVKYYALSASNGCCVYLPDATNRQNVSFGHDGIVRTIGRIPKASAQMVCDELIKAVAEHQDNSLQYDDMTVVVVRANGWDRKSFAKNHVV
jgi:Stage II sporulation protein E (SpoIIE)